MNEATRRFQADPRWQRFIEQADREWEKLVEQEQHLRDVVLPVKALPFASAASHPETAIDRDVMMHTRDGIALASDVYRPTATGKYPVLLLRTPYDKRGSTDDAPAVARELARRGYACIIQDVRGRYGSEGEFVPRINEMNDGYDAVEWAAQQPWSNGRVGMWGVSYGGFTSLAAAATNPPHLVCIQPSMVEIIAGPEPGGAIRFQGRGGWLIWANGRYSHNPLRIDFNHLPLHEIDEKAGHPSAQFDALVTMDLPRLHVLELRKLFASLAGITAKGYFVAGWYDELLSGMIDAWLKARSSGNQAQILIGPWHHDIANMEQPRIGLVATPELALKQYYLGIESFFDQNLRDTTGSAHEQVAPVRLFTMGCNEWRDEEEWPLARTIYTSFYFHSTGNASDTLDDGLLDTQPPTASEPADAYVYDPLNPVAWSAGTNVWGFLNDMTGRETIEARKDVLVYSSKTLTENIEVTGPITMTLFAATDVVDTDFVVTLVDVYPNGHEQYLLNGLLRTRFRNGLDRPDLIEPDKIHKYKFALAPTSNVFKSGHRIRIEIASSDFNRYARNQNTGAPIGLSSEVRVAQQRIYHDRQHPSHITLPIIPA